MKKSKIIEITKEQWGGIPKDYKGKWSINESEKFAGKRTVLSGCISNEIGSLLTEGIHFKIV